MAGFTLNDWPRLRTRRFDSQEQLANLDEPRSQVKEIRLLWQPKVKELLNNSLRLLYRITAEVNTAFLSKTG